MLGEVGEIGRDKPRSTAGIRGGFLKMGYTIMIGQAYLNYEPENQLVDIRVEPQKHSDAPADGENSR